MPIYKVCTASKHLANSPREAFLLKEGYLSFSKEHIHSIHLHPTLHYRVRKVSLTQTRSQIQRESREKKRFSSKESADTEPE